MKALSVCPFTALFLLRVGYKNLMKCLGFGFVALIIGCGNPLPVTKPAIATRAVTSRPQKPAVKTLDYRLIGTWKNLHDGSETRYILTKDHKYSWRFGTAKFKTGYYEETGMWDIYDGNRLELTPVDRASHFAASEHQFKKWIRHHEKAMDEGAWKPKPIPIVFTDDDHFFQDFDPADRPGYSRVR